MSKRRHSYPMFYQVPGLLLAALLGLAGIAISSYMILKREPLVLPAWLRVAPWGLGGAAMTLVVGHAIYVRRVTLEHLKVAIVAVAPFIAEVVLLLAFVFVLAAALVSGC